MTGTFLLGERKTRPGAYYRRERAGVTTEGATNGILACIFQSNWGVLNKEFDVDQTMLNELEDYFGDGADILREGLLGGATTIRAIRVGGGDGECAKVTFKTLAEVTTTQNLEQEYTTTGTAAQEFDLPANFADENVKIISGGVDITDAVTIADDKIKISADNFTNNQIVDNKFKLTWDKVTTSEEETAAVELSAKYPGDRDFTASIRTNLLTDQRQLFIYDGTEVFLSVTFAAGDDEAQSLVDALANNRHFAARKIHTGELLDITQAALTGGVNPTVTTASYDKGTQILERYTWNVIVADTDEVAVKGILTSFVSQSYQTGRLGMACIAGQSSEDLENRMAFAASINDEKVIYLLNGWVGNDGTVYDGWRGAARIGGMVAASESNASLTHTVVSNALELIEPLTNGEITRGIQKGCLVLSLNSDDQIWIDAAVNTLVTLGTDQDEGWKKIRRTKCRFELMDRINATHDKLVGKINNNTDGRATLVAAAMKIINEMIAENKLVFGSYVEEDPGHPAEGDRCYFKLHILDLDSAEFIYNTFVFRFGQTFDEE